MTEECSHKYHKPDGRTTVCVLCGKEFGPPKHLGESLERAQNAATKEQIDAWKKRK